MVLARKVACTLSVKKHRWQRQQVSALITSEANIFKYIHWTSVAPNHQANTSLFVQQQHQQVSHATIWHCSCDSSLLRFSCHLMHRAGQELLAPVRHRAIPRWWAHWFMEECHRLLQMGRDHLQFRYDGHRCLAGFMEPSWAHLSFPCQPHQFAALESVPQLLNRKPTTGVAVLKQHCYP